MTEQYSKDEMDVVLEAALAVHWGSEENQAREASGEMTLDDYFNYEPKVIEGVIAAG